MQMCSAPYDVPAAWRAADLEDEKRWVYELTSTDIEQLDAALQITKRRRLEVPNIGIDDFPLSALADQLSRILAELERGLGVALIRNFPMERYTKPDAGTIFWGIGAHLGRAVAQNAYGDVLGHVRDLGKDWTTDMNARGYQTTLHQPFHNDSCDVAGLLCLRTAKSGGLSSFVSSVSVHNAIAEKNPDLWSVLWKPFYVDRRGEQAEGHTPYYLTPIFSDHAQKLFVRYNRMYIESGQRFDEAPRLTPQQIEALDQFDALCHDDELRYDMALRPGDMQFLNNYVVLHSRSEYEDYPEPDRKRHLLRLWLFTPGLEDIPDTLRMRYRDMDAWQANPRPPIYKLDDVMNVSTH